MLYEVITIRQLLMDFLIPECDLQASSSATSLVAPRFIPELATMTEKENTDIIISISPIPARPMVFEIYTLNETPIILSISEVAVMAKEFIKNSLTFLIFPPHLKIYERSCTRIQVIENLA